MWGRPGRYHARVDTGDTAWLLASSALVLLMAPGLALFYGGMVRSKSVLELMMMTFGALAAIAMLWTLLGYSPAFGDDLGGGLVGDPRQYAGLGRLRGEDANAGSAVPLSLFATFQGLFCVISALIIDKTMRFRVDEEHEISGIDLVLHAETAYDLHASAGSRSGGGHGLLSSLTHREDNE